MILMLLRFDTQEELDEFADAVELDDDEYATIEITEERITVQ